MGTVGLRQRLTIAVLAVSGFALLGAVPASAEQYVKGGGFEGGIPLGQGTFDHPDWDEEDSLFPSPICGSGCESSAAKPHGGAHWALFGEGEEAQIQWVTQTVNLPTEGNAILGFHVWVGRFNNSTAELVVELDEKVLRVVNATNVDDYDDGYVPVTVPLGTLKAGPHSILFGYLALTEGTESSIINVDDVSLEAPPAPSPAPRPLPPPPPPPLDTKILSATLSYKATAGKTGKTKRASANYKAKQGKTGKAKYRFSGEGGTGALSFQCKLDGGKFKPCTSPKAYSGLKPGTHKFEVRAVDATGSVDPTPAKRTLKFSPELTRRK